MLRRLLEGIAERAQAEQTAQSRASSGVSALNQEYEAACGELRALFEQNRADLERIRSTAYDELTARFDAEQRSTEAEYHQAVRGIQSRFESTTAAALQERDDAKWLVNSVLDEKAENSPKQKLHLLKEQLAKTDAQLRSDWQAVEEAQLAATALLAERRQLRESPPPVPPALPTDREELRQHCTDAATAAQYQLGRLRQQAVPRLFIGMRPWLILLFLSGALFAAIFAALDPAAVGIPLARFGVQWIAVVGLNSLTISALGILILYSLARRQSEPAFVAFQQHALDARLARQRWASVAKDELQSKEQECQEWYTVTMARRDQALLKADTAYSQKMAAATSGRDFGIHEANSTRPARMADITQRRQRALQAVEDDYQREIAQVTAHFESAMNLLQVDHAQRGMAEQEQSQQAWDTLGERWQATLAHVDSLTSDWSETSRQLFPGWPALLAPAWKSPTRVPPLIRFGQYEIDLAQIENGLPADQRLAPEKSQFEFPACLPFPESLSLILKASDSGRAVAVKTMQAVMLRLLTSIPPGNLRFTILDPMGLGENFSAFMHLADYDELMVTNRIWTEAIQIEQRLADLTGHMENVFQTYLRNEFKTIEEYNAHAGEVAEPYHILVAANFPVNFSETAARRLASIANSGSRCGVYVLVSVDTKQHLPHNFHLADLEQQATVLQWKEGRFQSADADLSQLPLTLDQPPEPELFSEIVRLAGRNSKDARRVEVPFERVAPKPERLWACDSRGGIDVPLGRAGATKLQNMRLGRGTSQHVLVAGKTGSGKSSFLHALITNLALHYSPTEVEFYLIDFKKGVEFKTYATHALPHARVIAIESDREFGVSALQSLDALLKERGDLFRSRGVQDIESYRNACPDEPLPRTLLIVDEFQEFFVEDDSLAQEASLLLDRLVRQGRAFGIHVLLGSQTLGGAYSLARSTLGQVAVRVALQCSETDAHLILSEENTAARLLTRPGEAIYNDANGLVEGNHPFQIVWLSDEQREVYLQRLQELTRQRQLVITPPIVFEGNIPADPRRNALLTRLVTEPVDEDEGRRTTRQAAAAQQVWLGEAVAIKGPTTVTFRRQSGHNLLIVGQSGAAALGMLGTSAVGLVAQNPVTDSSLETPAAQFIVLDGGATDLPDADAWKRLSEAVSGAIRVAGPLQAAAIVTELAAEVERRQQHLHDPAPPVFLLIFNLGRFRDLRKGDDDFSFSMDKNKPPSAGKLFGDILRDGPPHGVHTLAWCDTYNNVSRWLSREMLREMEMRVAFQMSATDSSNLVDSPAASRLGEHRALLSLAEQGTLEKFRPYGPPSDEWLAWVRQHLGRDEPEPEEADTPEPDLDDLKNWTVR